MIAFLAQMLLPFLVVVAAAHDFLTLRIPNWLNSVIALAFFPLAIATGMPAEAILWHCLTGLAILAASFGLFSGGFIGGGDAKLLAAAGLWFGWPDAGPFLVLTALAGGVLAIAYKIGRMFKIEQEVRDIGWVKRWLNVNPDLPYGIAIAAGAILFFPSTGWWLALPR
jgi:prepilin peptidase CpaA